MRRCFIAAIALSTVGVAYSSSPVARWDVVPYQRVEGRFKVGVVAFHEDGVKVGFAINGKMVAMVAKPDVNPRTGVREFFFEFDDEYGDHWRLELFSRSNF